MPRRSRTLRVGFCALIACLLYLPALGRPALWEPDEGRYAEIAREMVQSGDYVTPRDDWVRYFEKPPLMYWAEALAIKLLGANEFAVRLPAALFSIGQVAITCALAEVMFGAAVGLAAAASLAFSPLFFGFSRFATLDPALSFFVTAALGCFYMAARAAPGFARGAARGWLYLAAAMMALGTLSKGPVAVVISGGVALVYMVIEGRGRELVRIPWLGCALIYVAITAPWFVLVARRNPDFLEFFFVHEHLQRYLSSTEHAWGPYFFIPVTLAGMWPWIYFVPRAIAQLRRHENENRASIDRSALLLLLIWFGFVLVFFSVPRSKLGSYILPGLPPLAILAGYGLCSLCRANERRARRVLSAFTLVNIGLAAVAVPVLIAIARHHGMPALGVDGAIALGAVAGGAVAAFAVARDSRRLPYAIAAIIVGSAAMCGTLVKARGDAAALLSYRGLARAILPEVARGCVLASYHHIVQSLPFYCGTRELLVGYRGELAPGGATPDALGSFIDSDRELMELWASARCVVLIVNRSDLANLTVNLNPRPTTLATEGKKLAISNRPPANLPVTRDRIPAASSGTIAP